MLLRLAALTFVALIAAFAAPAHATLLVRADALGLFVQDKNGLNDFVLIGGDLNAYRVSNGTSGDIFRFDRQGQCSQVDSTTVSCQRNGPNFAVELLAGNDTLDMDDAPTGASSVIAGFGDDEVRGHFGADSINGGTGKDDLRGLLGNDTLEGGGNDDLLVGGHADDTLKGGDGADALFGDDEAGFGDDVLRGGAGNDFFQSREPVPPAISDGVECGTGFDTVEADSQDVVFSNCEEVDQSPIGEGPHVDILGRTLRVSRSGRVRVRLHCPRQLGQLGCNGRLRLRLDRRSAGRSRSRAVRYRIRAGRRKVVALRLTSKDVNALARRQRRGRRTRGVLTSVERGIKGPKTTIRNPRLRLR